MLRHYKDAPPDDFDFARDARHAGGSRASSRAGRWHQSLSRTKLSRRVGLESPRVDWRKIRRARSRNGFAASRSRRAAQGAEISRGESMAHRKVAAAGNLRLPARLVDADDRSRGRPEHPGARAVSRARRIRALLYARRPGRRIRAAHSDPRRAHLPGPRMVRTPPALAR